MIVVGMGLMLPDGTDAVYKHALVMCGCCCMLLKSCPCPRTLTERSLRHNGRPAELPGAGSSHAACTGTRAVAGMTQAQSQISSLRSRIHGQQQANYVGASACAHNLPTGWAVRQQHRGRSALWQAEKQRHQHCHHAAAEPSSSNALCCTVV